MCALWSHLVSACEIKAHLIGCWQYLGSWNRLFLAAFGLNLVVVAVLQDSRVIGCCPA